MEGKGEWNAGKHGGSNRRLWRKIHIGIDAQTLEIRAKEATSSRIGDAPVVPDLLSQIRPDQEVASVRADGAYNTRKCHDAIVARTAYSVRLPRKNAQLWKPDRPVRGRETKLSDPRNIWALGCGGRCLDITAEAALRRKCIVLNCLVNASQRVTSIGRSRKTKSVRRSLTGSPRLAFPEQSLQAKSVWGKGKHDLKLICAAKPCCGPEQGC